MAKNAKRKWRFTSRSLFTSRTPGKLTITQVPSDSPGEDLRIVRRKMSGGLGRSPTKDTQEAGGQSNLHAAYSSSLTSIASIQSESLLTSAERDVAVAIARSAAGHHTQPPQSNVGLACSSFPMLEEVYRKGSATDDITGDPQLPAAWPHVKTDQHHGSKAKGYIPACVEEYPATSAYSTIVHRPHSKEKSKTATANSWYPRETQISRTDFGFPAGLFSNVNASGYPEQAQEGKRDPYVPCISSDEISGPSALYSQHYAPGHVNIAFVGRSCPQGQSEISTSRPTILTVEATANAKIFFETYYDPLLAGTTTSRSLRRRLIASRATDQGLTDETRRIEIFRWIASENAHLRQIRAQKSRISTTSNGLGVTAAGFEAIRVLGKGSFGVVKLVREQRPGKPKVFSSGPLNDSGDILSLESGGNDSNGAGCSMSSPDSKQHETHSMFTPKVYAMKVIRKSDMLKNCQEGHLRAERDFLVASENSEWVVPLIASFQDDTNLYLVMEYMIGGDFLGLLFRRNILKEKHARWYVAEMVLCLEETHRYGWIHRDVKPDNFLISASGHLKISDFGLAFDGHWAHDQRFFKSHRESLMDKLGIEVRGDKEDQKAEGKFLISAKGVQGIDHLHKSLDKARTHGPCEDETILQWRNREGKRRMARSVVGTSQYMAPEVIRGEAYDGRCDWWSIGIILYEVRKALSMVHPFSPGFDSLPQCLYGFTPFVCASREDTKKKIMEYREHLVYPRDREYHVSSDAISLMSDLIRSRSHRLCSNKYKANDDLCKPHDPSRLVGKFANSNKADCMSRFVYPDDATDIKRHRFFSRISWDRHHLTRPPFVPDVDRLDDTKYFDGEDSISDLEEESTLSSGRTAIDQDPSIFRALGADGQQDPSPQEMMKRTARPGEEEQKPTRIKQKKRARDKVLRDKRMAKQALDVRKKAVFIGYTYRRPPLVVAND